MIYTHCWDSPLGNILLAGDETAIAGLWFAGQKHFPPAPGPEGMTPAMEAGIAWLEAYFSKIPLPPLPPLAPMGTDFQKRVWSRLMAIPYGSTCSYGDLARELDCGSARAVGSAVGRNPISLMIPCHRVVGGDGRLTGYAGGLERKRTLLELEGAKCKK